MALTASDTQICNMALAHLGITTFVGDITTEQSPEAQVFNLFFQTARDNLLRMIPWPFAGVKNATLSLVTDFTTISGSTSLWAYAYRYPADCLKFLRVQSLRRQDSRRSRIPYLISQDGEGQIIYTNQQQALADYTTQFTNSEAFPPDFVMALSFYLAFLAVRPLTGGDPYQLGPKMEAKFKTEMTQAAVNAINEDQVEPDAESEFITARDEGSADPSSTGSPWSPTTGSQLIE